MMTKRLSYPRTTVSQRQHLFRVWQETGDVQRAVSESRVSERTFYYWKQRFERGGYEALESFASSEKPGAQTRKSQFAALAA